MSIQFMGIPFALNGMNLNSLKMLLFFPSIIQNTKSYLRKKDSLDNIGRPTADQYKHIDFPRLNIIIKRGGLANFKSVEGNKVVVTSVKDKKDGTTQIKLKRTDGGRFFGSHSTVAADFKDAIGSGELQTN